MRAGLSWTGACRLRDQDNRPNLVLTGCVMVQGRCRPPPTASSTRRISCSGRAGSRPPPLPISPPPSASRAGTSITISRPGTIFWARSSPAAWIGRAPCRRAGKRAGAAPHDRILAFIRVVIVNRAGIMAYGCPVGRFCAELAKLEHVAQDRAAGPESGGGGFQGQAAAPGLRRRARSVSSPAATVILASVGSPFSTSSVS